MNDAYLLVIDDEPQLRKLLEIILESNGYKVQNAATAKEGLVLSANHPPDLILLDIGLPDENIVNALDSGANDYIIKPFRTGELLARIRTSLRLSNGSAESPVLRFGD